MDKLPGIKTTIAMRGLGRLKNTSDRLVLIGIAEETDDFKWNTITRITDDAGLEKLGSSELRRAAARALNTGLRGVDVIGTENAEPYQDAIKLALEDSKPIEVLSIVDVTDANTWSNLALQLKQAAGRHQYTLGVVRPRLPQDNEGIGTWISKLTGEERSTQSSLRLANVAGDITLSDGSTEPLLFSYLPLVLARQAHEAVDAVKYGPIPLASGRTPVLNDGQLVDMSRNSYTVAREYYGTDGIFITLARIDSDADSDFDTVEKTRVMNRACRLVRAAQLQFVNDTIAVSVEELEMFKAICELPLNQMQANGEITDFVIELNDIDQILQTNTIRVRIRIVPLGKLSYIENEISFSTQEAL